MDGYYVAQSKHCTAFGIFLFLTWCHCTFFFVVVALKRVRQSTQQTFHFISFSFLFHIAQPQLLFKDETLEFFLLFSINQMLHNSLFHKPLFLPKGTSCFAYQPSKGRGSVKGGGRETETEGQMH